MINPSISPYLMPSDVSHVSTTPNVSLTSEEDVSSSSSDTSSSDEERNGDKGYISAGNLHNSDSSDWFSPVPQDHHIPLDNDSAVESKLQGLGYAFQVICVGFTQLIHPSLDIFFLHPRRLDGALQGFRSLMARQWIFQDAIDFWCLSIWKGLTCPKFRYILSTVIAPLTCHNRLAPGEIAMFRSFSGDMPGPEQTYEEQDFVYILNTGGSDGSGGDHYCTLAFLVT